MFGCVFVCAMGGVGGVFLCGCLSCVGVCLLTYVCDEIVNGREAS